MGTLGNLFEVVRDTSYRDIEEEATREVVIALAGNSAEVRDKLHRALSTRLESLWTSSPFRLIETNERPVLQDGEGEDALLLYTLYRGDRIPSEKRNWLQELARSANISVIVILLDRKGEEVFGRTPKLNARLQAINPLRLVGGKETGTSNAAADGAAFNRAEAEVRPAWETELAELAEETGDKISIVELSGLELSQLQAELLPLMVRRLKGRELALARRAPIFRNTVAGHFIADTARSNAQLVLLTNLAAGVPLVGDLLDSGADFVVLTKNQFELIHRLAGVYGQKRDNRVEIYLELAPIVGAAFAWKAISAMISKKVPAIISMLPKTAIAYGATMLVGWTAQLYYASGRKAPAQISAAVRRLFEQVMAWRSGSGESDTDSTPRQLRSS
jgi:uncharacterized protein (DUF697 family)